MNKNILRDPIDIKLEILGEVSQYLPAATKDKIERLEYEFMSALNEISKEYLEKTKKPEPEEAKGQIKKVTVE